MALDGKVCVVTGAGSGIGQATALEMAARGAAVVEVLDLDEAAARDTVRSIVGDGGKAVARACDVADERSVAETFAAIGEAHGRIDVLHNNAAVLEMRWTEATSVDTLAADDWDRVFAVNVRGTWLCTKHAVPWLRRSSGAAIVNMGSTAALTAFAKEAAYATSKAAVLGLTRATALDLAPDGIRCVAVCPSSTATPMVQEALADANGLADEAAMTASHLVHRLGRPQDIARLVCFLASDEASFMTGASYMVDGGALAWRGLHGAASA